MMIYQADQPRPLRPGLCGHPKNGTNRCEMLAGHDGQKHGMRVTKLCWLVWGEDPLVHSGSERWGDIRARIEAGATP